MWYLQAHTLFIIALFSLASALLRRLIPVKTFNALLPLSEIAVIAYISRDLALNYAVYIAAGLMFSGLLFRARQKLLFAVLSISAAAPFFIGRLDGFGLAVPPWLAVAGMAFAMLRQIDLYYYIYYTGEPVRPLVYINYMLFLPVLTAGPIFRYRDFMRTFDSPLRLSGREFTSDVKRIVRGMFKKVVLARLLTDTLDILLSLDIRWYISAAVAVTSYLILYFDLSGYSDIAIAFGRLAGYDVPENFKRPMRAPTFTRFWRSWHATLSDWIREHIYVVFAKKKLGKPSSAAIAFAAMTVMSLWHGFNLPYLLAGVYNGVLLAGETLLSLTTANIRKSGKGLYYLRCFAVNFLFALNTLVFTLPAGRLPDVLSGFLKG